MEWTKYTTKEALKDNDELMILDTDGKANKRTLMDKIWDYVVDKMTTAVIAKLGTTNKTLIGAVNELNSNIPIIESVNKVITAESGKDTYDLGVNADEYMIISIQPIDRNGWIYTISRGVSGTEGTNNWSLCFVNNSPTGAFTFKIITLKIK